MAAHITEVMGEMKGASRSLNLALDAFARAYEDMQSESSNIRDLAQNVAAAAEQSTTSVENISVRTNSMSESMDLVSAAMEKMNVATHTIEERCKFENTVVGTSQQEINATNQALLQLQTLVKNIGNITQAIEDIAAQTNLLALNATIKAASAGEASKEISVVANEVKVLARQTADSTGDITAQVEQIQQGFDEVMQNIVQLTATIEEIGKSSAETLIAVQDQHSLVADIKGSVGQAVHNAGSIAVGISEIVSGSRSTTENIAQVSVSATNTSQEIEKSSAQMQSVAQASQRIEDIVAGFKAEAIRIVLEGELLTTVKSVDNQHAKLFDLLHALSSALVEGLGSDKILKIIDELGEYTRVHFRDEEQLMARANFPDLENHKKLHKIFEDKIEEAKARYLEGQTMVAADLVNFLTDWLVRHIGRIDQKYVPYMRRAGLS